MIDLTGRSARLDLSCLFYLRLVIFLILTPPTIGWSQTADERLWASATIQKELTPRIECEYEQEVRYKQNYTTFYKTFGEFSLYYRPFPKWKVGSAYRYISFQDETGSRFTLRSRYKNSLKQITYTYRLQLQGERVGGEELEKHLRNRITLRYPVLSWLEPYIQGEFFHLISGGNGEYRKYRRSVGLRITITKNQLLKCFYREQKEVNVEKPDAFYIMGLAYELGL